MPGSVFFRAAGPIGETDIDALPVKEIGPAVGYYTQCLGFALVSKDRTTARLRRDDVEIGLTVNGRDPEQASCWFSVDDVDALRREYDAKGIGPGSSTSRSTTASLTASSSPRSPAASASASPSPSRPDEESAMDDERVTIRSSEPIFPVADVVAAVGYYRDVLGFREGWTWGEPPDFGGVRWGKIGAMFALSPGPEVKIGGQCHSFFVEGIDALHAFHRRNGAAICSPLEAKPWGLREYTVRDLNGHHLRFGQRGSDRTATAGREPAIDVAIVERLPTPEEYLGLLRAVGWARGDEAGGPFERAARALAGVRFGVVAVDGGHAVGSGMVLGDGATFAYLKDIMVRPEWQARGLGTRIVDALLAMLRRSAHDGMLVTLFTGQHLAEFYERFGFSGPEALYGMSRSIERPAAREAAGAAGEAR